MYNNQGLSEQEAQKRLEKFGLNEIKRTREINPWKIFLSQFTSPLVLILIFSALVSYLIGFLPNQDPNLVDVFLILFIVFMSGISGFFQEYKAEKSIEALQKFSTPNIQVIRDGQAKRIPANQVVVGDLVLLEAGDIIPADGVVLEENNLKINESILTGESTDVKKRVRSKVYKGTSVYVGNAKILIEKTGMQTDIGKIADKLQSIEEKKTPFEEEITLLSKKIFWLIGAITIFIFIISVFKYDLYTSFLESVSLAVAAIPEGLPAVVVLALALGAKSMFKNNALVRKLSVTESVGAVNIICTDKTGTLTKNEMTVTELFANNKPYNVNLVEQKPKLKKDIEQLILCGVLCNNVRVSGHPAGEKEYLGEQTEISLIKVGEKFGFLKNDLDKKYLRIKEEAFSSERKMMSVLVSEVALGKNKKTVWTKGAPEIVLKKCNFILKNNKIRKITAKDKKDILDYLQNLSSQSLRVLGFAFKKLKKEKEKMEENLVWIGLQGMIDPPNDNVPDMIKDCYDAQIRIIMITGDSSPTAVAIAKKIGLKTSGFLEGKDLDKMSENELKLKEGINVFARTTAFHKLKILKILNKKNIVAMTGDGVNDALALKEADVGIAMGKKGTTVAKESSDIILLDDNFSTIVSAVKEGRRIFDNIRKFINYLLVSNLAEVLVIFGATLFFTLKEPILLPVQILWINLLTDGFPALALGIDPANKNIMKKAPRKKNEAIINKRLSWLIGVIGTKKTIVLFLTFLIILPRGEDLARTALFTGFILYEFVRIATIRYQEKLSWLSNPWLLVALGGSLLLQFIVLYTPLNKIFHVAPLGIFEWIILTIGVVLGYFLAIFLTKIILKRIPND